MNVLSKAVSDLRFKIPEEILRAVFIPRRSSWQLANVSIDEQIMSLVILPRVMVDCNIIGGTDVYIPLDGVVKEFPDDRTMVFKIPKSMTQGRSIISVNSIMFHDPTRVGSMGMANAMSAATLLRAGNAVVDSVGSMPITSTAKIELIAENTVMMHDYMAIPSRSFLSCRLGYDDNMSNIPIRAYNNMSKMVEYAVKSYIYNRMVVAMDMGELFAGNQLGRIKDVIDGYADSEELYETYRKEIMQKVLYMADSEIWTRHIKLMIGGRR